jgi:hypothetical protein
MGVCVLVDVCGLGRCRFCSTGPRNRPQLIRVSRSARHVVMIEMVGVVWGVRRDWGKAWGKKDGVGGFLLRGTGQCQRPGLVVDRFG